MVGKLTRSLFGVFRLMIVEQPLLFPLIATVSPKLHKMYISSVIAMVAPKLDGFVILVVNMLCYPNFFFATTFGICFSLISAFCGGVVLPSSP